MDDKLRRLQLEELEILKMFAALCDQYKLRYFLLGGTLLGAIRHDGFIPWDDDVDVCMPRSDYEKFLKIASGKLQEPYSLSCQERNPEYRYCFARISSSRMKIRNRSANKPRIENAWIDIIPMDGMPQKKPALLLHKMKLRFWRGMNQIAQYDELVDQKRKRGAVETVIVKIAGWKIWRQMTDYHKCMEHIRRELKKYDYDQSDVIINYMAAYGFKEVFNKKDFGDGAVYYFEGIPFKGPVNYDAVLKTIYGDYMKLPPESDRNKHNAEILDA
ncbi:MAG: LicD family protein [Lachnospiraceae bacterium]|nr:LicD family protein [Lachnospiraceae bacterium]